MTYKGLGYVQEIELSALVMYAVVVSVSTIGIVEFFKSLLPKKSGKAYALLSFVIMALCSTMQMSFVSDYVTIAFNIFALGMSMTQLAHGALIKVPQKLIEKLLGGSDVKTGDSDRVSGQRH